MSEKLTYTNRKGQVYYFHESSGKRGKQIVCSMRESENDLPAIPKTHEIVESPNGQVSCRKKIEREITNDEISNVENVCPGMVEPRIKLAVEEKKKAIIIHSKQTDGLERVIEQFPLHPGVKMEMLADHVPFEAVLKFELTDRKKLTFAAYRMCWIGGNKPDWLFLDEGSLPTLLKKYVRHIGKESFYDLF